jgi:hypothetical protein
MAGAPDADVIAARERKSRASRQPMPKREIRAEIKKRKKKKKKKMADQIYLTPGWKRARHFPESSRRTAGKGKLPSHDKLPHARPMGPIWARNRASRVPARFFFPLWGTNKRAKQVMPGTKAKAGEIPKATRAAGPRRG